MEYPSFTKTFHHSTYSAISPTRNELSCKDKTVIVTGGGSGIGAATALSYAKAGATSIALVGRTESKLLDVKSRIESAYPSANVCTVFADVSNAEAVGRAAHDIRVAIGAWDVFIHCAAITGEMRRMTGADIDDWWHVFEVNVKFLAIFAKHFLTKCRLPGATFICANAGAAHFPTSYLPACSAYSSSELAAARACEWLAKENPGLRVFSAHPGIVKTPLAEKSLDGEGAPTVTFDSVELAADFFVWVASPEAEFLRGRFVCVNWDVEEMIQKQGELEKNSGLLTCQLGGWPFL